MATWEVALSLDPILDTPLFLQIARGIAEAVRAGRLRPGDKLPGTRRLADTLAVHRNTVIAAYDELVAEGWLESRQTGGTYVSAAMPDVTPRPGAPAPAAPASALGYALRELPPDRPYPQRPKDLPPGTLNLGGTDADLRLVPVEALGRAYRRALVEAGPDLLGGGDPRGHLALREALAEMLAATRGLSAGPEGIILTRGSQMALYLVAKALLGPGDVVAVEQLGYRPAWESLAHTGARLIPVPIDGHGLDLDALEELAARETLRAVYLTPHHHYPTTVTLHPGRRLRLLALARERGFAVIEDDYDAEFHYEGRPVLPLAASDTAGVVVYAGTLSKILAPGLRQGFVVGPPPLIARLARHRVSLDLQGDQAVEAAIAALIGEREVQRHALRMRRIYQARRDHLVALLRAELPEALAFTPPAGGMAIWCRVADGLDAEAWAERALARGVAVATASRFDFDARALPYFRLGFAGLAEPELGEAVARLAAALP